MRIYQNNNTYNENYNINDNTCFADLGNTCGALRKKYCEGRGYCSCKFYKTKEELRRDQEIANEINIRKGINVAKYINYNK